MKRLMVRIVLVFLLVVSACFAGWSWFRPYDWNPDPAARCEIVETLVTRDQSYFWVHVHLKLHDGQSHDLEKKVWLETPAGRHEAADSTFGGISGGEPSELWFKFWLDSPDLAGDLKLHLNEGSLVVRKGSGAPDLRNSTFRNFTTSNW